VFNKSIAKMMVFSESIHTTSVICNWTCRQTRYFFSYTNYKKLINKLLVYWSLSAYLQCCMGMAFTHWT